MKLSSERIYHMLRESPDKAFELFKRHKIDKDTFTMEIAHLEYDAIHDESAKIDLLRLLDVIGVGKKAQLQSKIYNKCKKIVDKLPEAYLGMQDVMQDDFTIDAEEVYLSVDASQFHTGTSGFVITDKGIYCKQTPSSVVRFCSYDYLKGNHKTISKEPYIFVSSACVAVYHGKAKEYQIVLDFIDSILLFCNENE